LIKVRRHAVSRPKRKFAWRWYSVALQRPGDLSSHQTVFSSNLASWRFAWRNTAISLVAVNGVIDGFFSQGDAVERQRHRVAATMVILQAARDEKRDAYCSPGPRKPLGNWPADN